jgi:hypothetical protein
MPEAIDVPREPRHEQHFPSKKPKKWNCLSATDETSTGAQRVPVDKRRWNVASFAHSPARKLRDSENN